MLGAPSDVLLSVGTLTVYWYGVLVALGMIACATVVFVLARAYRQEPILAHLERATFPVCIGAIVGARALFVAYHADYFFQNPLEIPAVWHGGWVWHGALIGGALVLFCMSRRLFWSSADLLAPGLALGQAVGRWGNYANQEAYGMPTSVPWAALIDEAHRLPGYESFSAFHPAFLYESLADLVIFGILLSLLKRRNNFNGSVFLWYVLLYSIARFAIELIRIDAVPVFAEVRAPQWLSLALLLVTSVLLIRKRGLVKNSTV